MRLVKIFLLLFTVGIIVFYCYLYVYSPRLIPFFLHDASDQDMFFNEVAAWFNAPQICAKISPRAYATSGWGASDGQISYFRTDCYWGVAMKNHNGAACSNVRPLPDFILNGSMYAPANCLVRMQDPNSSTVGTETPTLGFEEAIMEKLGYSHYYDESAFEHLRFGLDDRDGSWSTFIKKVEALPNDN